MPSPIPSFPTYSITSTGRILNSYGMTLTPYLKNNYLFVGLEKDHKRGGVPIHRCVVEAFIGPISRNDCVIHRNGDVTDNRLENLEIVPRKNLKLRNKNLSLW